MDESGSQPPPGARAGWLPGERRHPLRFVWQSDAQGLFTVVSDEFLDLMGPCTAAHLGRSWPDVAAALDIDPEAHIARALATHDTWSGLCVAWPLDGVRERLIVELSGLPVFDRARVFCGYRGFGVCRDLARLSELAGRRQQASTVTSFPTLHDAKPSPAEQPASGQPRSGSPSGPHASRATPARVCEANANVLPFRAVPALGGVSEPPAPPRLSRVERRAVRELSRRLSDRLAAAAARNESVAGPPAAYGRQRDEMAETPERPALPQALTAPLATGNDAKPILDRFPVGVLIYRLNALLYANRAFLDWAGHETITSLAEDGGLDSLFIEPGAGATEEGGQKPFQLACPRREGAATETRLFSVPWEGESAFALVTTAAIGGMHVPPDPAGARTST